MFVKNKAKVASRVGCSERSVMCFRKLLRKSDKKKLSFRRVESEGLQSSRKRAVVEHFASEWNSDRWKERKSYITLHKIVFRVPKITRTARTLCEIKGVIWEYSYVGNI